MGWLHQDQTGFALVRALNDPKRNHGLVKSGQRLLSEVVRKARRLLRYLVHSRWVELRLEPSEPKASKVNSTKENIDESNYV